MRIGTSGNVRRDLTILAILSVVYIGIALTVSNSYYQLILTLVPIWAAFGVSWNILSGYGGQLSFGHASFFGIGAYTTAILVTDHGWSLVATLPVAAAVESLRIDASIESAAAMAWAVLVTSIAANTLLLVLIRRGAVSRTAALLYLMPPVVALQAVYDSLRDRVLVVGGNQATTPDTTLLADPLLWSLELSGTPTMRPVVTGKFGVERRHHHRILTRENRHTVVTGQHRHAASE